MIGYTLNPRQGAVLLLLMLTIFFLSACSVGPPILRSTFLDYSEAYAYSGNNQMLLNLARGANHHPPYFLQLAGISSTFEVSGEASLLARGSRVRPRSDKITEVIGQSSLTAGYGEQPTFDFTPLSGKSFAQVVLSPISQDVFFSLFQQGFPADMLLRGVVQALVFEYPDSGRRVVLENIPDLQRPERFFNFLRIAAIMRQLQLEQAVFVVRDAEGNPQWDFTDKADPTILQLFREYPAFQPTVDLGADLGGGSLERRSVSIQMRTFAGALDGFSTEHQFFDAILANTPEMLEGVPPSQRRPILRFQWNDIPTTPAVAEVSYLGQRYQIADPLQPAPQQSHEWNREAFSLLLYLYSQVSLDPGDLPTSNFFRVLP